jgi:hypothetical protein
MIKKEIHFTDFDGNNQVEEAYFNLTEPEIVRLDAKFVGGLDAFTKNIDPVNRPEEVVDLFEDVLSSSYGVKSEDGRRFVKDPVVVGQFLDSAAYSALFMELLSDAEAAAAFMEGVLTITAPTTPTAE